MKAEKQLELEDLLATMKKATNAKERIQWFLTNDHKPSDRYKRNMWNAHKRGEVTQEQWSRAIG